MKRMQLATSHTWSGRCNKNDNMASYRIPTNTKVVIKVVVILNKNLTIRVNKKIQSKPDWHLTWLFPKRSVLGSSTLGWRCRPSKVWWRSRQLPLWKVLRSRCRRPYRCLVFFDGGSQTKSKVSGLQAVLNWAMGPMSRSSTVNSAQWSQYGKKRTVVWPLVYPCGKFSF